MLGTPDESFSDRLTVQIRPSWKRVLLEWQKLTGETPSSFVRRKLWDAINDLDKEVSDLRNEQNERRTVG